MTSGIGYAKVDGHSDIATKLALPPPFPSLFFSRFPTDLKQANTYAYFHWSPLKNATVTFGASGEFAKSKSPDVGDRRQFNPKFGVTWNPWLNTTIRAAAFRTLKRTLITDQTIEPTQVAGFNQFFDDFNGTSAWNYGVALDQKFTKELFTGAEYTRRDLNSQVVQRNIFAATTTLRKDDMQEDLSRLYLFWAPHRWWALRAEYQFEHFKSDGVAGLPIRLQTYRIPLGVNFFHPSGFSATLSSTYVNQAGRFVPTNGARANGSDAFWTVDAGLNYRLPDRYGIVTVGVTNLTDRKFKFYDRDFNNPSLRPGRMLFGKITIALP